MTRSPFIHPTTNCLPDRPLSYRYRTKQHRDAAVSEMEKDKAEALALLLELQVKATILMQKIVRGKQKHPVIPARRAERDRLIAVRIEAAEHIQRRRRRELERRYWRKKYVVEMVGWLAGWLCLLYTSPSPRDRG